MPERCIDKGYYIPQPTTTVDKVLAAMTTCCADTLSQTLDIVNSALTDETRCVCVCRQVTTSAFLKYLHFLGVGFLFG